MLTPSPEPPNCVLAALKNQDILNLIFEHFDLQPCSHTVTQTRKDLFSAAKTCKAFVEPALNSLWRVLPSPLPLLLLLPSAEVYNGHFCVDELPLDGDQYSDWGRLDIHARRVRTLYMEPLHVVISPNIYLRIRAIRESPLLPGLNKIYIPDNLRPLDLSSVLFLVSGTTLNMVQLGSNAISDRQFFAPFLSLLYIKSPGLAHLALHGVVNVSLGPIYRFTKLQSLELKLRNPHLEPQLLQKLGEMGHLLDLVIDTGTSMDFHTSSIQSHTVPPCTGYPNFRKLRKLQILGTASLINRILNEMKGLPKLTILKIEEMWDGWKSRATESSWKCSFEAISTFSAVEDIEITHALDRPKGQYVLSASCLSPLFRLDNMMSLVINLKNAVFSGSDDDIRLLAGAFPKLKKLVLPGPPPHSSTGRTLACLYHLSRECPDLRELKIYLSFNISDNLNAIKKVARPIIRNYRHPLEKLCIKSEFGQPLPVQLIQVARFLDFIFPNLSNLGTDKSNMTEVANWAEIHECCLALQDARMYASASASDI